MKKVISLLLALVMALSLLPTAVWAEGEDAAAPAEEVSESFFDSSHPFTWNDGSYVWRFWWNGPDGSRGEWHLYAAPEGTSADSADGWTDCGAEATPFEHLTEGTLAYAAAFAMRSAWEAYEGDEKVPPELMWLIDMMTYESVAYTNDDAAAAQAFMSSLKIGMDGGTATLVLSDSSADELLNAWYATTPAVRAALQKTMHCELLDTGHLFNFTQLLHRTLKAADAGQGGSGESFDDYTEFLRQAGFTAPRSVDFSFPEGLVRGVDYDYTYDNNTGDLRITLHNGGAANWINAANRASANRRELGVDVNIYPTDDEVRASALNGNGGFEQLVKLTKVTASDINSRWDDVNQKMIRSTGGGAGIATVNRVSGIMTIAPNADMNHHRFAVVWGDENGSITHRELVSIYITMDCAPYTVNTTYQEAQPLPAAYLETGFEKLVSDTEWTADYQDGKLVLTTLNGIQTSGNDTQLGFLHWDKMAPAGYAVERWARTDGGNNDSGVAGSSTGVWTWNNRWGNGFSAFYEVMLRNDSTGDRLLYSLEVLQNDGKPSYAKVSATDKDGNTITSTAPAQLGLDTEYLKDKGIILTYDARLGCFHTSYVPNVIPDYNAMVNTSITLEAPEGAVYFTRVHQDGGNDPRCGGSDDAARTLALLQNSDQWFEVSDTGEVAMNARSVRIMLAQEIGLSGINVCLSRSNNYRSVSVAWWDADRNLIGMSYVYGQNDDFMNRTRLTSVETAEKLDDLNTRGEVNAPALVGAEGMELVCDRYPQTGDGMTQFFDLHLLNDQGGTKTVYIPYHCFGMSYVDDVQGKSADELPTILVRHFDANYNFRNEIIGRYEPQGIVYEYGNRDGENGQAFAFMITVYLGDTRYRLPAGETYAFSIYFDRSDATSYELYCPADPEDASSELVKQANPLSCVDGHNDDGHSWRQCTFTADHDGMFVIHPKDYQMQQSWPWWGVPTPPWTPSPDATTPDSEVPELQSLYASGFKFPVIGKDIHFVFPEQLKEWTEGCGDDWDYRFTVDESKGRVAIEVNMGSRERWEDAVRNIETGGLDDGVFFRYYFGNSDNQLPMTYGYDWYGDYDGRSLADNTLYRGYHHNNGLHLATVNRQNAHNSVLTLNSQGEDWRIILAMSNSEGKVAAAEAKYAFQLEILPREDISFSLPADNGTAVPAARLHPTDIHSDWTATVPADGSVFLRTVEGKTLNDAGSGQYGLLGELTVDAPEGYALREWRNNCTGGSGRQFPVPLFWDDQVITLIWQKDNAPDLVEYVRVEPMNYLPGFYSLGDENAPSRAPSADEFLSTAEQKKLSDNGITVTYDEKLGYFTTSVDASKLTDLSLLRQCVTLKAPENAVYFKFTGEGGSENPASHDIKDDINRFTEQFSSPDTKLHTVDPDRPVRMQLMHTEEIKLDGKTVYYSESQSYNSLIVQWLDEGKNVIGYTCLYGRNGDISTTVDTETVNTAPTEAVSVPTLVGTDLKLLCDRNPQTEDGKRLFLLFNVTGEGQLGEDGAEIYLPYSYFDLTAEEGMALAAKGIRPLIRHYLNENCTEKESLLGEYTAAGVRIVTRSFSPFLIDANGCTVGDLNGDGAVDTLDMQALYENLSTGHTTEKLADKDDFRLLADCNGDGAVNILDYQKLYQGIKTA